jgi:hypothetical protein
MRARPQDGNGGPVERDGHRGSETVGDGGEEPWRHERSGLHVTNVERPGLSARADIFAKHLYLGRFYLEFCRERQIFDGMNNNNRIVSVNITTTRSMLGAILPLVLLSFPDAACGYSVLTHQALVDTLWDNAIKTVLRQRFPNATEEELKLAHGYAYGGCIIQDLGYYPFGSRFFSDLVHYVRSADFLPALLDESHDLNEYAFALGAVSHYGADVEGHARGVNRAVPLLYPNLRRKFGDEVTYADDPPSHLKTEYGFDVLQVARGHYPPKAYHDSIGFQVSKDLLERAFQQTYGLKLRDIFHRLDLALETYRYSICTLIPELTKESGERIINDRGRGRAFSRSYFI